MTKAKKGKGVLETEPTPDGYQPSFFGVEDDEYLESLGKLSEADRKSLASKLFDLMDAQKAAKKSKGALSQD